jgi:hypothetical protein
MMVLTVLLLSHALTIEALSPRVLLICGSLWGGSYIGLFRLARWHARHAAQHAVRPLRHTARGGVGRNLAPFLGYGVARGSDGSACLLIEKPGRDYDPRSDRVFVVVVKLMPSRERVSFRSWYCLYGS